MIYTKQLTKTHMKIKWKKYKNYQKRFNQFNTKYQNFK